MDITKSIKIGLVKKSARMKDLAAHCNTTQQYMSEMASGKINLPYERIKQFAEFFGVPVSEFIRWGE